MTRSFGRVFDQWINTFRLTSGGKRANLSGYILPLVILHVSSHGEK
jgi:hypothetical protein